MRGSSTFALAADAGLRGNVVFDEATGVTHLLNPSATAALRMLEQQWTLQRSCAELAAGWGVDVLIVRDDVEELLLSLDDHALLLERRASLRLRVGESGLYFRHPLLTVSAVLEWMTRRPSRPLARRFDASFVGVSRATLRSLCPVLLGIALVFPLVAAVAVMGLAHGTAAGFPHFLGLCWGAGAAFALLLEVHELSHLYLVKAVGGKAEYAISRSISVAVAHGPLRPGADALVGAGGPVGAFLAACAAAAGLHWGLEEPIGLQTTLGSVVLALGLVHLLSLGPWSSDGRSVLAFAAARFLRRPAASSSGSR